MTGTHALPVTEMSHMSSDSSLYLWQKSDGVIIPGGALQAAPASSIHTEPQAALGVGQL